ncbi:hypothetical protein ACIP98_19200 [Streptomyces sp. NPDC088354]|uniref:hypothetical protein n=1 Tax=unclassified Streptomyces TaxID=2593676 RepID=UPI0029AD3D62|nr:hypothetical protein [Streptomyces sp. MI02-7b]MDX3072565.1 hypothetical protein [Streptomyces sp. MI02-7b]
MTQDTVYVRFQATVPNRHGRHPGLFALVNGLGRSGVLSAEDDRFWRENNAWYEAHYTNPSTVDPTVYDRAVNPGAAAWFKHTAGELLDRTAGYLELLARHHVACERLESSRPGRIIYEDDHQVVVVPHD